MNLKSQLSKLTDITINEQAVAKIEMEYDAFLPNEVRRIISLHENSISYDDFSLLRGLSYAEIIDAPSDMSVDFIDKKILPLFDLGDNDYVVYDFGEQCWYKFNIADDVKFSKTMTLADYFIVSGNN